MRISFFWIIWTWWLRSLAHSNWISIVFCKHEAHSVHVVSGKSGTYHRFICEKKISFGCIKLEYAVGINGVPETRFIKNISQKYKIKHTWNLFKVIIIVVESSARYQIKTRYFKVYLYILLSHLIYT